MGRIGIEFKGLLSKKGRFRDHLLQTILSGSIFVSIFRWLWAFRKLIFNASILFWFKDSFSKNGGSSLAGDGSIKSGQGVPNPGSKSNPSSNSGGGANKSRPKYLECWGDADKPFAWSNITENNATAKSTAMMVMNNNVCVKIITFWCQTFCFFIFQTLSMIESNLLPER